MQQGCYASNSEHMIKKIHAQNKDLYEDSYFINGIFPLTFSLGGECEDSHDSLCVIKCLQREDHYTPHIQSSFKGSKVGRAALEPGAQSLWNSSIPAPQSERQKAHFEWWVNVPCRVVHSGVNYIWPLSFLLSLSPSQLVQVDLRMKFARIDEWIPAEKRLRDIGYLRSSASLRRV